MDLNHFFDVLMEAAPWIAAPTSAIILLYLAVLRPLMSDREASKAAEKKAEREHELAVATVKRGDSEASHKRRIEELEALKVAAEAQGKVTGDLALLSQRCADNLATAERMAENNLTALKATERLISKLQVVLDKHGD